MAQCYKNQGVIFAAKYDLDKALSYHEKSLKIRQNITGERSPSVAESYHYIGEVHKLNGDTQKAREFLLSALKMRRESLGTTIMKWPTHYTV